MAAEKILILCTDSFPYGFGETFLEPEISIIASHFRKVILLPDNTTDEVRSLPGNVETTNLDYAPVSLTASIRIIFSQHGIRKEFFKNLFSKPLRNKVLIKTVQRALSKQGQLTDILKKYPESDVLIYTYWLNHAAVAACLLKKNIIRISRVHNWDIYEERQKYGYLPLRPYLLENLNAIYSISKDGVDYLRKRKYPDTNLNLSGLGVTGSGVPAFSEKPFSRMLSISSLIPLKRVQFIGEAFQQFKFSNLIWGHYGSGPMLEDLKTYFPTEIKGQRSHQEVMKMLELDRDYSFLINLSEYEGIPVSMMEAMSFGIPCIGTDVGGVREIISDGFNGFLLPPNPTLYEVVSTIQKMMDLSGEKALRMRKAAYKTWEEKYNAEVNYMKFSNSLLSF